MIYEGICPDTETDGSDFYLIWAGAIKAITASIHLTEVEVYRVASRSNAMERIVTISSTATGRKICHKYLYMVIFLWT